MRIKILSTRKLLKQFPNKNGKRLNIRRFSAKVANIATVSIECIAGSSRLFYALLSFTRYGGDILRVKCKVINFETAL